MVAFSPSATVSDPQITFSTEGTYTIRLTASDTQYAAVTSVVVEVVANLPQTVEVRVLFRKTTRRSTRTGRMEDLSSSDLEMVQESDDQIVGIRFRNVSIPPGAVITHARWFSSRPTKPARRDRPGGLG